MATIRQRGKSWEVQIRRDGGPTLTRTFSLRADARAWASIIESEMERGVFVDRTEAERNTFGDLLERYLYLAEVSNSKKGAAAERYRISSLLRDPIAQCKMAGLSSKRLAEWRDRRLKEVSGSTTNRDLNLISHVINVARKEWGIHIENPVAIRPAWPMPDKPSGQKAATAVGYHARSIPTGFSIRPHAAVRHTS